MLLGLFLFVRSPSGRAFKCKTLGVVEDAVEDGIGEVFVGEVLMPGLGRQLAGHDCRFLSVASPLTEIDPGGAHLN